MINIKEINLRDRSSGIIKILPWLPVILHYPIIYWISHNYSWALVEYHLRSMNPMIAFVHFSVAILLTMIVFIVVYAIKEVVVGAMHSRKQNKFDIDPFVLKVTGLLAALFSLLSISWLMTRI